MIVITGPGRSGTSLIAKLYLELGFDPGGSWIPSTNAGLEETEVVRANLLIMRDLGFGVLGPPVSSSPLTRPVLALWKRIAPARIERRVNRIVYRLPTFVSRRRGFMRWDRFQQVVEKHRSYLHEVAREREVVKDPRFMWTLGIWAAAGVEIDHVLVCVRPLNAMIKSRAAAGHLSYHPQAETRTALVYGLGLCMTAIYDNRFPHSIQQFPDFLEHTDQLYEALKFPTPISHVEFMEAFRRVACNELVHDRT